MTHNMQETDNFFTVREPAWHGLGHVLLDYPTRQQAQALAHPWEPVTEPIYVGDPSVSPEGELSSVYTPLETHVAVRRSDNNAVLGVVSDTYKIVSNTEMWDVAEAVQDVAAGDVLYQTAGSLKGGKKVWVLLRLKEPIVIKGDRTTTMPYYAVQDAKDGSGAFRGQGLATQIVCDNTARHADLFAKAHGTEIVFRHTGSISERIEEAKQALAMWREGVTHYTTVMRELVEVSVTREEEQEFIERFIPLPPPNTVSDRVRQNILTAQDTLDTLLYGATNQGVERTAYGLLQASIEYAQHYRNLRSSQESAFARAYLDDSKVTRRAVALVREIAHV